MYLLTWVVATLIPESIFRFPHWDFLKQGRQSEGIIQSREKGQNECFVRLNQWKSQGEPS